MAAGEGNKCCCVAWGKPNNLSEPTCPVETWCSQSAHVQKGAWPPALRTPPSWSRQAFLFTRGPSLGWKATGLASSAPCFLPLPLQCLRPGAQGALRPRHRGAFQGRHMRPPPHQCLPWSMPSLRLCGYRGINPTSCGEQSPRSQ